jgi:hypothetical protein
MSEERIQGLLSPAPPANPHSVLWRSASYALVAFVAAVAALSVDRENRRGLARDALPPTLTVDARFTAIGKDYAPKLAAAYAAAWTAGAFELGDGSSPPAALGVVASTWATKRADLFDAVIKPELSKIVPEDTPDADVTPAERAALAAAFRGLAAGLGP